MELEVYYDTNHQLKLHARNAVKSIIMVISLAIVWYVVMLITGWYNAGFHIFAVFSSAIMTKIAPSSGLISRLAE
ncbi:MAG: hypothetical protein V1729_05910 [Candidatus Woesearchaeota archaeon]